MTGRAVVIAGRGPTGLKLAGELTEEPERGLRYDALGIRSLGRIGDRGPV